MYNLDVGVEEPSGYILAKNHSQLISTSTEARLLIIHGFWNDVIYYNFTSINHMNMYIRYTLQVIKQASNI